MPHDNVTIYKIQEKEGKKNILQHQEMLNMWQEAERLHLLWW